MFLCHCIDVKTCLMLNNNFVVFCYKAEHDKFAFSNHVCSPSVLHPVLSALLALGWGAGTGTGSCGLTAAPRLDCSEV